MELDRELALRRAFDEYNRESLAEFEQKTGMRYLGEDGPVYLAGSTRIRGLFVDAAGGHWCDARLVAESAYGGSRNQVSRTYESLVAERLEAGLDLWIVTIERGRHDAIIARIAEACEAADLPAPELFAPGWARSWRTFGWMVDASELACLAGGGPGEPGLYEHRRAA